MYSFYVYCFLIVVLFLFLHVYVFVCLTFCIENYSSNFITILPQIFFIFSKHVQNKKYH